MMVALLDIAHQVIALLSFLESRILNSFQRFVVDNAFGPGYSMNSSIEPHIKRSALLDTHTLTSTVLLSRKVML